MNTERIEQHAVVPAEASSAALTAKNDAYEITVQSVYFDGRFLHSALELKSDIDVRENDYYFSAEILLNRETVYTPHDPLATDIEMDTTPYINWMNTGSGSYMGNLKFTVPEKYRTGEALQVEYVFSLIDSSEYNEYMFSGSQMDISEEMEQIKPAERGADGTNSISFEVLPDGTDAV